MKKQTKRIFLSTK